MYTDQMNTIHSAFPPSSPQYTRTPLRRFVWYTPSRLTHTQTNTIRTKKNLKTEKFTSNTTKVVRK